jgi:protein-disulfide isomerase
MTEAPETPSQRPELPRLMLSPSVSDRDHAQGLATAATTLVQYGDYHERHCAAAQVWIKDIQAQMGNRLRLVFRHCPANAFHPNAAHAAEAAGMQDHFWEMHDTLFAHSTALGNGFIVEYAEDLRLNIDRFLHDMAGDVAVERVRQDLASAAQSGVQNTPTFFVNDIRQQGVAEAKGAPLWATEFADLHRD